MNDNRAGRQYICDLAVSSKPLWVILLAFKAKSRPECVSVCTNAFNNSDEFKVCTLVLVKVLVLYMCLAGINKLLRWGLFPIALLTTLLIYIVYCHWHHPASAPEVTGPRVMTWVRVEANWAQDCTISSSFYKFLFLSIEFWTISHHIPVVSVVASICFQYLPCSVDTLQHWLYTYSDQSGGDKWSGRQWQRELEEFHSQTRSGQKHQECTKRSLTLEAVRVPRSRGGAGTPGACRMRTEVRAALGSTGTATVGTSRLHLFHCGVTTHDLIKTILD